MEMVNSKNVHRGLTALESLRMYRIQERKYFMNNLYHFTARDTKISVAYFFKSIIIKDIRAV